MTKKIQNKFVNLEDKKCKIQQENTNNLYD